MPIKPKMLYVLFLGLAILYNWWKFSKEREALLSSLTSNQSDSQREMILSHFFYVFIFECFLAFIVAHYMTERAIAIGILGLGFVYFVLLTIGFFIYKVFLRHLEKTTQVELSRSFQKKIIKELRVNIAVVLLPMMLYALINVGFQGDVYKEWGTLWFLGLIFHILFVSVLTIICTVVIMLKMLPNREVSEPEYLALINRRLEQVGIRNMRVHWIESDIKNAFVVGLKLFKFSNQTLFIGRKLRSALSMDEFDAVICHELAHVANRHTHKRMIDLVKNFISVVIGTGFIVIACICISFLVWGEEASLHGEFTAVVGAIFSIGWFVFSYGLLFDMIRSHEYEADAYAVIELKVPMNVWQSALIKLTAPEELPDYLKARIRTKKKDTWYSKYFSTHPELTERIEYLEKKIREGLPFDHYVSRAKKLRGRLSIFFNWKVAVPLTSSFIVLTSWTSINYVERQNLLVWLEQASPEAIMGNGKITKLINSSPSFIGPTFMSAIVKKENPILIDHFLKHGADYGKTLIYISQTKNFDLLKRYYGQYQDKLTEEHYFLVLRRAAQVDFTEGYRYLVNAKHFETLRPTFKEDVSRIYQQKRRPASTSSR